MEVSVGRSRDVDGVDFRVRNESGRIVVPTWHGVPPRIVGGKRGVAAHDGVKR